MTAIEKWKEELSIKHAILISIKPEYAKQIWARKKTIEFRRVKPCIYCGTYFVYESGTGMITGQFQVSRAKLDEFSRHEDYYGISQEQLMKYTHGEEVWGLFIENPRKFSHPISLKNVLHWRAPQNFRYLNDIQIRWLNEHIIEQKDTEE